VGAKRFTPVDDFNLNENTMNRDLSLPFFLGKDTPISHTNHVRSFEITAMPLWSPCFPVAQGWLALVLW